MSRSKRIRRAARLLILPFIALLSACAGHSAADKKAIELSSAPIAEDASWTTYVHNAKGDYVYPTGVQVEGNRAQVRNPE
ncbi:MAG TPA: hypothetical protein PLU93_08330, partial [Treponemataceae bacterium]|nr:hypothetical protein [Treponemataceae bacterium]